MPLTFDSQEADHKLDAIILTAMGEEACIEAKEAPKS